MKSHLISTKCSEISGACFYFREHSLGRLIIFPIYIYVLSRTNWTISKTQFQSQYHIPHMHNADYNVLSYVSLHPVLQYLILLHPAPNFIGIVMWLKWWTVCVFTRLLLCCLRIMIFLWWQKYVIIHIFIWYVACLLIIAYCVLNIHNIPWIHTPGKLYYVDCMYSYRWLL